MASKPIVAGTDGSEESLLAVEWALVGLSARADLLVIGRHGKHPSRQGPGTVRHTVLNHAHGTIAIVPSS